MDGDCDECKKKSIMFLNCPLEMDNNNLVEYEVFRKVNSLRDHHSGDDDTYTNYGDQDQTTNDKNLLFESKLKKPWLNLSKR